MLAQVNFDSMIPVAFEKLYQDAFIPKTLTRPQGAHHLPSRYLQSNNRRVSSVMQRSLMDSHINPSDSVRAKRRRAREHTLAARDLRLIDSDCII